MSKKVYTSYFAKHGKHPQAMAITVRVPLFAPKMRHCDILAPSWKLVDEFKSGRITENVYRKRYLEMLSGRGTPQELADRVPDGAVLLCYESEGKFCHRHIAAEYLRQGGIEVEELP